MAKEIPENRPKKKNFQERREIIINLIKRIGLGNIHRGQLAKELDIDEKTLYTDIKRIIREWSLEDIKIKGLKFDAALDAALRAAHKGLMTSNKPAAKSAARRDIAMLVERYTKFMEDFKFKEKVPEKSQVEMSGNLPTSDISKIYDELKRKRTKADRDREASDIKQGC